jgi:hypothetical protein
VHNPLREVSMQITGPHMWIERQLEPGRLRNARRCELHGKVWIELHAISDDELKSAVADGCRVHFSSPPVYYVPSPGLTLLSTVRPDSASQRRFQRKASPDTFSAASSKRRSI